MLVLSGTSYILPCTDFTVYYFYDPYTLAQTGMHIILYILYLPLVDMHLLAILWNDGIYVY